MKNIFLLIPLLLTVSCSLHRVNTRQGGVPGPSNNPSILVKTVHFHVDRADVIPEERKYLDNNVRWFQNNVDEIVILEGHTDQRGSHSYNMDLGDRRARWVKSYLVKKGVNPKKIITISYGEARPLDHQHNRRAWKRNRRVVFKLARE